MFASRFAILSKIAYRQKLANLITLLVFIIAAIFFQQSIDSKEGFFLQGYGNWVYYLGGTGFLLLWAGMSATPKKSTREKGLTYIISEGEIDEFVVNSDPRAYRLSKAFLKVIRTLDLDYRDYTLTMKDEKVKNAFATGLSRGKRVCVYTEAIDAATDSELESVIAHEMGHTVNRDMGFLAVLSGIGCTFGCIGSIIGLWIVWRNWGFWATLILFGITSILLPAVQSHASRVTEEFADSFAAIHGYGPGLISFLRKIEVKTNLPRFLWSHPAVEVRERYVQKIMDGDQGAVSDNAERVIWQFAVLFAGAIFSGYLYLTSASVPVILSFVAAVCFFLCADTLMRGSSGTVHVFMNLSKKESKKVGIGDCLSGLFGIIVLLVLYLAGIYACFYFMGITSSIILAMVARVMFYLWIAKPVTSLIGVSNDIFAVVSDLTTFGAVITSLLMIASFFVAI